MSSPPPNNDKMGDVDKKSLSGAHLAGQKGDDDSTTGESIIKVRAHVIKTKKSRVFRRWWLLLLCSDR